MPILIECVANFSEGRNHQTIDALVCAAESVAGAALLDRTSDVDHNRTVLTIAGNPAAVAEAVPRSVEAAMASVAAVAPAEAEAVVEVAVVTVIVANDARFAKPTMSS